MRIIVSTPHSQRAGNTQSGQRAVPNPDEPENVENLDDNSGNSTSPNDSNPTNSNNAHENVNSGSRRTKKAKKQFNSGPRNDDEGYNSADEHGGR